MRVLAFASPLVVHLAFALGCSAAPVPPDAPAPSDVPTALDVTSLLDAPSALDGATPPDALGCGPCESPCCALSSWGNPVSPFCPPTPFWECGGGPRFDAGPVDANADPDALDRVSCASSPPVFPAFSRQCSADADCIVARHQVDCCGSIARLGISEWLRPYFESAEAECESEYPDCDCFASPDVADDGTTGAPTDTATVRCVDFVCTTSFAPGG